VDKRKLLASMRLTIVMNIKMAKKTSIQRLDLSIYPAKTVDVMVMLGSRGSPQGKRMSFPMVCIEGRKFLEDWWCRNSVASF
jgi:hypothetical protein